MNENPTEKTSEKSTDNLTFSSKRYYKRKYHEGLKVVCVNKILIKIVEDENKFVVNKLKITEEYNGQKVAIFFSKYLSKELNIYVSPQNIEEFWPIVSSILKFILYDDDNGRYIYATEELKIKGLTKAKKHKALLKKFGYNIERLPRYVRTNGMYM